MAEQEAFAVPSDLWANEDCSEEALRSYVAPPLTKAMIDGVEQALGYILPRSYVQLARTQNGGLLKRRYVVVPQSNEELQAMLSQGLQPQLKVVSLTNIFGIGGSTPWSLCGEFGTAFMVQKWGYPAIGLAIAGCADFGHSMVFLDYSQGTPEPQVVLVEQAHDFRKSVLAPNFATFIALLKTETELSPAQRDFEQQCDAVRQQLKAQRAAEEKAQRAAAEAQRKAAEAQREAADAQRQAEEARPAQAARPVQEAEEAQRQAQAEQQKQDPQHQAEGGPRDELKVEDHAQDHAKEHAAVAETKADDQDTDQVPLDLIQARLTASGWVRSKHDFAVRAQVFEHYRQRVLARWANRDESTLSTAQRAELQAVSMVQGTGFKGFLVNALMGSSSFVSAEGLLRLLVGEMVQHHFAPNAQESAEERALYDQLLRRDLMALLLCIDLEKYGSAHNGRFWLHFDDGTWERILGYLERCHFPSKQLSVANITPDDVLSYSGKGEGFGLLQPLEVGEWVDFINDLSESHYHCAIIQRRSVSELPNFELGLPPAFRNDVLTNLSNFAAANYPDNEIELIAGLLEQQCFGSCLNNVLFGGMRHLPDSLLFDVAQGALILDLNRYALSLMRDQVEGQNLYLALYVMGMAYYGMCRTSTEQQRRIVMFNKKQEQGLTSLYENMALPRSELFKMSQQTQGDIQLFAHKATEALGTYLQLHADQDPERLNLARQAQSYIQRLL